MIIFNGWRSLYLVAAVFLFLSTSATHAATISGFKWSDLNNDGVWQKEGPDSEPGVEGWQITLSTPTEIVALSLTGVDGRFSFDVNPTEPTTYRLTEGTRDGWQPTFPQGSFFDVFIDVREPSQTYQQENNITILYNFGNHQLVTKNEPAPTTNNIQVGNLGGSGSGIGSGGGSFDYLNISPLQPQPQTQPQPQSQIEPTPQPPQPTVSKPVPIQLVVNKIPSPPVSLTPTTPNQQGFVASLLSLILGIFRR